MTYHNISHLQIDNDDLNEMLETIQKMLTPVVIENTSWYIYMVIGNTTWYIYMVAGNTTWYIYKLLFIEA